MKKTILDNVILVQSDLFTPLTRTPWAGGKIVANYKNHLHPEASGTKVGESWEFSCDPKFSSRVKGQDFTFNDIFEKYPEESLSAEQVTKWGKSSHILIKLPMLTNHFRYKFIQMMKIKTLKMTSVVNLNPG